MTAAHSFARWFAVAVSLNVRKALSYRLDFWVSFLGRVLAMFLTSYFLWGAVFAARGQATLAGYTFPVLMLYYLLYPLASRVIMGAEMGILYGDIYDGSVAKYLVYPANFFVFKYASQLALALLGIAQLGLLLALALPFLPAESLAALDVGRLAVGVACCLLGSVLYFLMAAPLELVAFWQEHVWSLLVMLRFAIIFLGGGLIPLAMFPAAWRTWLDVLPFPYVAGFPVRVMLGEATGGEIWRGLAIMLGWTVVFAGVSAFVWSQGTRKNTGVGL